MAAHHVLNTATTLSLVRGCTKLLAACDHQHGKSIYAKPELL